MKLRALYHKLEALGITNHIPEEEARLIRIYNRLSLISLCLVFPFPLLLFYHNLKYALYLYFCAMISLLVPFIINSLGYSRLSRAIGIIMTLFVFLTGNVVYGHDSGLSYGALAVMPLPILYFRETTNRIGMFVIMSLMMVVAFLITVQYPAWITSPNDFILLRGFLFFTCTVLIISYFHSSDMINREYEQRNKELVDSLMVKNKDLKRFSYSVSHDLKEPLRTISSFTQLLKKDLGDKFTENSKDYYEYIVLGARQMNTLLDDVLHYSKLDNHEVELEFVNLNVVISRVLNQLTHQLKGIEAEIEVDEMPLVYGTEVLMVQLFQNLISNAIKFRKDGEPFRMKIWSKSSSSHINVYIRDHGIGIDEVYQEKIFDIFKRLHPRYKYEGSGIGLATCQRIMEKIGGHIAVQSQLGEGSTFIVSFPTSKENRQKLQAVEASIFSKN